MILTHGLKRDIRYVKGFSDISSKSIEPPQKSENWGYNDEPQSSGPTI